MAGKPRDRRELRRQYDAAEPLDPMEDEAEDAAEDAGDEEAVEKKPKKKPKAPAKPKTKTPKAAKPAARMRIVWVVMNDAFKTIGTFDYNQREAADAKAKEMMEKGKGTHFVQRSKEPMPDDAPGLGAVIPRPIVEPKAAVKESVAVEEEEEVEAEADEDEEEEAEEPEDEE
jgi:hypothetical protein